MQHRKKFIRIIGYHRSKNCIYLSRTLWGNAGISRHPNVLFNLNQFQKSLSTLLNLWVFLIFFPAFIQKLMYQKFWTFIWTKVKKKLLF